MGVPGLFAFFKRRYGVIARFILKKDDGTWDGAIPADALYVDMNHIIHSCTHANAGRDGTPYDEDTAFERMDAYLTALLEVAGGVETGGAAGPGPTMATPPQPSLGSASPPPLSSLRLLFVAIDGVAPIAKMNQQRTRRFLSAHVAEVTDRIEREVRAEMASQVGGQRVIPDMASGRFDPNIISPGTAFMARVAERVRHILRTKVQSDPRFAQLRVIVSDSYEPAEGEHKIMRFIRHMRTRPDYDPNTQHVIYGQDADLLLLSLLLHEPHVRVLREGHPDQQPSMAAAAAAAKKQQQRLKPLQPAQRSALGGAAALSATTSTTISTPTSAAAAPGPVVPAFEEVDISLLRECLQWEFAELCGAPDGRPLAAGYGGLEEEMEEEEEEEEKGVEAAVEVAEEEEEEEEEERAGVGCGMKKKCEVLDEYAVQEVGVERREAELVEEVLSFEEEVGPEVQQLVEEVQQLAVSSGAAEASTAATGEGRLCGATSAVRSPIFIQTDSAINAGATVVVTAVSSHVSAPGGDDEGPTDSGSGQVTMRMTAAAVAAASALSRHASIQVQSSPSPSRLLHPQPQPKSVQPQQWQQSSWPVQRESQQQPRPQLPVRQVFLPPGLALSFGHLRQHPVENPAAVSPSVVHNLAVQPAPAGQPTLVSTAPAVAIGYPVAPENDSGCPGFSGDTGKSNDAVEEDEDEDFVADLMALLTKKTEGAEDGMGALQAPHPTAQAPVIAAVTSTVTSPPAPAMMTPYQHLQMHQVAMQLPQQPPSFQSSTIRCLPPFFQTPSPPCPGGLPFPLTMQRGQFSPPPPPPPPAPPLPPPAAPPPPPLSPPELGTREAHCGVAAVAVSSTGRVAAVYGTLSERAVSASTSAPKSAAATAAVAVAAATFSAVGRPSGHRRVGRCRGWWPRSEFLDLSVIDTGPVEVTSQLRQPVRQRGNGGKSKCGQPEATAPAAVAAAAAAAVAAAAAAVAAAAAAAAAPAAELRPKFDFEQVLEDLVVLTFLAGNDFLPHVPSIDIYDLPSGLELLLAVYKELLPQMKGCITQGSGQVNATRLVQLFSRLEKDEEAAFLRRAEHRRRCQKRAEKTAAANESAFWDAASAVMGLDGVSVGELPPGVDLDTVLSGLALSPDLAVALGLDWAVPSLDLTTATDQELRAELSKRVTTRTLDRVMGGDTWAADPCGMGLPGYRTRYYLARFPEANAGGDVEKVAVNAVRSYMDGLSWVYRYYCLGPAALEFTPDCSIAGGRKGTEPAPEGASWTWAYPYHYAPLMKDLADRRIQALAFRGRKRCTLSAAPVRMARELYDMGYCSLDEWAPPYGPVRPLLQLLCILPPRSAMLALPSELASMMVIAHEMDDDEGEVGQEGGGEEESEEGRHHHNQHQYRGHPDGAGHEEDGEGWVRGGGRRGGKGRGRGRQHQKALQSGPGGRGDGGDASQKARFSMLLTSAADRILEAESRSSSSDDDGGGCSSEEPEPGQDHKQQWGRFGLPLTSQAGGSWGLDGAGALSLHLLAQRVSRFFPSNIPPLVDLSGKKHLHTAVVRLPVVHPLLLAHVIQEGLRCGMQLTAEEKSRNRILPSDLLVSEALYRGALSDLGSMAPTDGIVWHILLHSVIPVPTPAAAAPSGSTCVANGTPAREAAPSPTPCVGSRISAAPVLAGALGLVLAARSGHPSLTAATNSTASTVVVASAPAVALKLDVAGLPVAATRASLLPGAQVPPLRVDRSGWRRLAAASARGKSYAERVLGISKRGGALGVQYRRGGGNMPAAQGNAQAIGNSQEYMVYGGKGAGGGGGSSTRGRSGHGFTGGRGRGQGPPPGPGTNLGGSGNGGFRGGGRGFPDGSEGGFPGGGGSGRGHGGYDRDSRGGGLNSVRGHFNGRGSGAGGGYRRSGGAYGNGYDHGYGNNGYGRGRGRQQSHEYRSQGDRRGGDQVN